MKKYLLVTLIIFVVVGLWFLSPVSAQLRVCLISGGCTGTSTAPSANGQFLIASGTTWRIGTFVAGSNITITTSTVGQVTIASTASGGGTTTTINGLSATSYLFSGSQGILIQTSSTNGINIGIQSPLVIPGTATTTITGNGATSTFGGNVDLGANRLALGGVLFSGNGEIVSSTASTFYLGLPTNSASPLFYGGKSHATGLSFYGDEGASSSYFESADGNLSFSLGQKTDVSNGDLLFYNFAGYSVEINLDGITANRTLSVPDQSGTFAVTTSTWTDGSIPFAAGGVLQQNNAGLFWDNINSRLGIGTSTPGFSLEVLKSGANASLTLTSYISGTNGGAFIGRTAKGTQTAPTASLKNNNLFLFGARGYGATGFNANNTGRIKFIAAEDFTDTAQGTHIAFDTNPIGSAAVGVERVRITDSGDVGIKTSTPSSTLHVVGSSTITNRLTANQLTISGGLSNATGTIGYDSTQGLLTGYSSSSATSTRIGGTLNASTSAQILTNSTTTDQDFNTIYTFPTSSIYTNKVYRVSLVVETVTGVSTATIIPYLKLGSTKVFTNIAADFTNSQTRSSGMSILIFGRQAAGASAAVTVGATLDKWIGGGGDNTINQPVTGIATNGTLALTFGVTYSATGSTETVEIQGWTIEEVN